MLIMKEDKFLKIEWNIYTTFELFKPRVKNFNTIDAFN
jgi:hypothetical protein